MCGLAILNQQPGPAFTVAPGAFSGGFAETFDGSSTAAWFTGSETVAPVLQMQHARPDDTLAAVQTLGTGSSPALATSTTGMTAIAWTEGGFDGGAHAVRVTLLDAGGAIVRTTTLATLTEDEASNPPLPSVVLDAAGTATVAWMQDDPDSGAVEVETAHVGTDGIPSTPVLLGEARPPVVRPG